MKCIENRYTLILLCKKTLFPLLSNFRVVCAIMIFVLQLLPMHQSRRDETRLTFNPHPYQQTCTCSFHPRTARKVSCTCTCINYPKQLPMGRKEGFGLVTVV